MAQRRIGSNRGDDTLLHSTYSIFRSEPAEFPNGLDMRCERKRGIKENFIFLAYKLKE